MPYVEGESLRHRLGREGRIPLAEALQIAREVADARDYAVNNINPQKSKQVAAHPLSSLIQGLGRHVHTPCAK